MSAPPLVLDVVPPPELPPVRSRSGSRWWSMLLVTVILGLVPVLALAPSARAYVWAVPVAKAVGATAVSWAMGEAVETLDKDDGNGGKKKGKWGDKLKGIPGLAVGLLGALWGVGEGIEMFDGDGDGLDMPSELSEELGQESLGANYSGRYATWTLDDASLKFVEMSNTDNVRKLGVSVRGACEKRNQYGSCPTNPEESKSVGRAMFNCFDPSTGGFWVDEKPLRVNGNTGPGCVKTRDVFPVESVILRQPYSTDTDGIANVLSLKNPDFDWGQVGDGTASGVATVTAEVQCSEVGTGATQTVTKTVASAGGVVPLAKCPTGWKPESIGWTETPAGGAAGEGEWLGGVQPTTPDAYPNCPPGECVRIIYVDGAPCNALRPECFDWMNTEPPYRVRCEFGPYTMPIADCADLENIHKSTHGVTWAPDPDGTPKWMPAKPDGTPDLTRVGTVWAPEENPNREYRPPFTGPLITFDGTPNPDPTAQPNPPAVPDPTRPVPNPPTDIPDLDKPTQNCLGGMASWNPVDWVVTPVKCALTWAFVPNNGSGPGLINDAKVKFTSAGLGPWLAVPPMLFGDLPQGGGCQGPALTMPASMGGKTYYPLNACSDPMAKYANMSRSLITIVVVFYGGFSIVNSLTVAMTGYRMFERETAVAASKVNT